jgi:hypothetical protein
MKHHINIILLLLFLFAGFNISAQKEEVFTIEGEKMLLRLNKNLSKIEADSIFSQYALSPISIDSLFQFKNTGKLGKEGWKIEKINNSQATLSRPLEDMNNNVDWSIIPILIEKFFSDSFKMAPKGMPGYPTDVAYGANKFKKITSVQPSKTDEVIFWLPEFDKAEKVFLSGNFNDWSHQNLPMIKTDSGWVASIKLEPGKYYYKFIVDGKWIDDPNNELKEDDGHYGFNSVFFKNNYTFKLEGYSDAKKVYLTGSFNNWSENEIKMQRSADGWFSNVYLRDGLHTYKFIVDGNWILDPRNKRVRPDGEGNFNSEIGTGDTIQFNLNGYTSANQVILSGSFNNWRTAELTMNKTNTGWKLDYMLPQGNYEYKFIVDGNWITDPDNKLMVGGNENKNSFFTVKPNYTFTFKADSTVKSVKLSGTFNNWEKEGYTMQKNPSGEWIFPLYLKPGKYLYKLIVDGNWIVDPSNSLWEENEFNNGNSVLWIENKPAQ